MCVAMVIIHTKTLEKKAVDDVTSRESLQPREPPAMSQALFSCGVMESGRRPVGSSLESLWDSVRETGAVGGISGLLRDLSLSEAPAPGSAAPPSKRQCRSLSCSDGLGWRSVWRPQGSRVWTAVEKRRCLSGGSVQRTAFAPAGFPAMQRSSSFSLPARTEPFCVPAAPQTRHLSHEQIGPTRPGSPDSTPELSRSRSQPCVQTGVKRRRPAHSHTHRPSLDLLKMTQKLQDFHRVSCPGFTGDVQALPSSIPTLHDNDITSTRPKEDQSEGSWAGLCSRRGRDVFQLGGELDIEQIERN